MSKNGLKNLSQLISALDQTLKVIFNARSIGVHNNWPYQEPFKCDPQVTTSPYLQSHQPATTKKSSKCETLSANEVLERLSIFMLGLTEYLKLIRKSRRPFDEMPIAKSIDLEFKSDLDSLSRLKEENNLAHPIHCQPQEAVVETMKKSNSSLNIQDLKAAYLNYELPEQRLNQQSKANRVPASRVGRIISYGELAAGLGFGALSHLTKRTLGIVDQESNVLLNEANANRIVETLCKVRGAALKIGQLLSIQDANIINPELQKIFERVRYSADFMPEAQLRKVLQSQLGNDWESKFSYFEKVPFAAASIGQVHRAKLLDSQGGTEVAVKIQYPGVAEGIESDLKNLVSVLKLWNILPRGLFIETMVDVTRRELAWEVDYKREAEMAKQYREIVEQNCAGERIKVPRVYEELSTDKMITTEMIYGLPIDKLVDNGIHPQIVNEVSQRVLKLCLREIFEFRFMQTDPNWSNFFYDPKSDVLSLIDFGATRSFGKPFVDKYMKILKGAADKDRQQILKESISIGFLSGYESKIMKEAHIDSVLILGQIFHQDKEFDFSQQDISERIQKIVPVMIEHRLVPPPEEIYSLHRKISGIFMLMTKLKAKVNCKRIFDQIYADYTFEGE